MKHILLISQLHTSFVPTIHGCSQVRTCMYKVNSTLLCRFNATLHLFCMIHIINMKYTDAVHILTEATVY